MTHIWRSCRMRQLAMNWTTFSPLQNCYLMCLGSRRPSVCRHSSILLPYTSLLYCLTFEMHRTLTNSIAFYRRTHWERKGGGETERERDRLLDIDTERQRDRQTDTWTDKDRKQFHTTIQSFCLNLKHSMWSRKWQPHIVWLFSEVAVMSSILDLNLMLVNWFHVLSAFKISKVRFDATVRSLG